ncbi:MAG: hypothetical protein IPI77_16525 [Saprospiraceae bacterium]|nr:hypothetical protein [Saprospiraceae bacterium]
MPDGIKATCEIENFESWIAKTGLNFKMPIEVDTAEPVIITSTIGNKKKFVTRLFTSFDTYKLSVIKTEIGSSLSQIETTNYRLFINGSLHKNHYRSAQYPNGANYQPFTFEQLQSELSYIEEKLCLDLRKLKIQNLEFGVNLPVNFPVMDYIQKNLFLYKVKLFERWGEKQGVSIGYQCKLSQFSIKIYDKALQFALPDPLMRFEIRVVRMQKLKKHRIQYLSDLQNYQKLYGLLNYLLDSWNHVLIHDEEIDSKDLSAEDRSFLTQCSNPTFWRIQIKNGYTHLSDNRKKFQAIQQRHKSGLVKEIHQKIHLEWKKLFQDIPI